ncbi:MAG TPA: 2OG-Fe(II) oxygenase [Gammaproteobacteria bacterium]|nr:2OG-Fe(II) oxygenase [Gammaproteobacteria bacterium]
MASHPASEQLSADVRCAEQADAAGAHGDAVNHLIAGTRKKDVEATTRLGKRLLVGDRAPCLPNDGAGLLKEASAAGGAEAACLLATLYAVGTSPKHDLAAALESLIVAAERGWLPAREQLEVLAAASPDADRVGGAQRWRELGVRIDLGAWGTPPPSVDLSASPLVRSYPQFVSQSVCRWLVGRARPRLTRALVYEALKREVTVGSSRTNTAASFNLLETDLVFVLAQLRMAACLGTTIRHFEAISVLHYGPGEEITNHYDFIDPDVPNYEQELAQRGERVVTFLIYLNDDYGAGETAFPRLDVSHKGRRGEGLFFVNALADGKPDTRMLHAGRQPSPGEKWIVSQFVRNRPVL